MDFQVSGIKLSNSKLKLMFQHHLHKKLSIYYDEIGQGLKIVIQ